MSLADSLSADSVAFPPWLGDRYKLVNLMAIIEFSAARYWSVAIALGQLLMRLSIPGRLNDEQTRWVARTIGEIENQALQLGLNSVIPHIRRFDEHVSGHGNTEEAVMLLKQIHYRIQEDFGDHVFLSIDRADVGLYQQLKPLVDPIVERAFHDVLWDISEAGKCLALNRSTAAVFHLMRAMEMAVQKFGERLGIVLLNKNDKPKAWQNILDEVDKAIGTLDQHAPATKKYAAISALLYNVKLAWRNEVMHPRESYSDEEAKNIFNAAKVFITEVASVL